MIGYAFLLSRIAQQTSLRMPPLATPAEIRPVTRIERLPGLVAVPRSVAPPDGASVLDHVLFALKHEAPQLAILHEALKQVPEAELVLALEAQRRSTYLRRAGFLWEKAHLRPLPLPWKSCGGNYVGLFDPATHYTGPIWERSPKYRITFNGIGPWAWCPVVARDPALEAQGQAILDRLKAWVTDPRHQALLDRVMGWAYLSETRDTWAIENETPTPDKERAFLQAMAQLREHRPITEDYLVMLRDAIITNPLHVEAGFRTRQNHLERGGHGALAVQYLPPPPEHLGPLIDGWMQMANTDGGDVPPLIKAGLVSFGFVFLHPFMDGNGRLSRLLAHHSLNRQQVLPTIGGNPAILPLSVAMKRHEADYLATLEAFSKPARQLWDVTWVDAGQFLSDFRSTPQTYAHWDGGPAAAFITRCAEEALTRSLVHETAFLEAWDRAFARIDREFDLPNRTIQLLIRWIQQNNGRLARRRRDAAELQLLAPGQLERIEVIVGESFFGGGGSTDGAP